MSKLFDSIQSMHTVAYTSEEPLKYIRLGDALHFMLSFVGVCFIVAGMFLIVVGAVVMLNKHFGRMIMSNLKYVCTYNACREHGDSHVDTDYIREV